MTGEHISTAPDRSPRRHALIVALLLCAAAFALRAPTFGSPTIGYDEQLYLLIGERMLGGALPFVDLWDRKPFGLFLIYAAISLVSPDGIIGYQVAATLSAAASAFLIALLARRACGWVPSALAGLLYIAWLSLMGGEAGQAPVFYNLPMAAAALLTLNAAACPASPAALRRGAAAMLLCGLALQVKTTAVFESCFFGLCLVHANRRSALPAARQLGAAALYILLGLAPTFAVAGLYAAHGALADFWFANAISAMQRTDGWAPDRINQLFGTLVLLLPLLCAAGLGTVRVAAGDPAAGKDRAFLAGWIVAAAAGFLSVGYFLPHYALPLLVPLSLAAARAFEHRRLRLVLAAPLLLMPLPAAAKHIRLVSGDAAQLAAIRQHIPASVRSGCMLVYEGPPILFFQTGACTVTRFVFPDHLSAEQEAPAIGLPQEQALRLALARRPSVIVTHDMNGPDRRRQPDRLLRAELRRYYRMGPRLRYRYHWDRNRPLLLWYRND